MSLQLISDGSIGAIAALPAARFVGEVITIVNTGAANASLVDSSTQAFKDGALTLATDDSALLYWNGTKWIELMRSVSGRAVADTEILKLSLTPGAEGAGSANSIDVVGAVTDMGGTATAAKEVMIRSLSVTDGQGDLAAATVAVGTVKKAVNPATGENVMWMTTTAGGLFSFKVTDTAVEDCVVVVECDGISRVLKLTFA